MYKLAAALAVVVLAISTSASGVAAQGAPSGANSEISTQETMQRAAEAYKAQDYARAMIFMRKAADQGDAKAEYNIGVMYYGGQGVARDYAQAMIWFRKAADQGLAHAQNSIGVMYNNGRGVALDHRQAMIWYRKAADQGLAEAQHNIGVMYDHGQAVAQDFRQAMIWFRKAADQGYAGAQINIGAAYYKGSGVTKDYTQAMSWFRKAADQGESEGQARIGIMYLLGHGSKSDPALALNWFQKAAHQGSPKACYMIGTMYEDGLGVPKDTAQATTWYQKAVELGDVDAKTKLAELQEPAAAKAASINLICQNARGKTLVSVNTALKSVKIQSVVVLEYKDGADQYVTITESAIEFGCRKIKSQGEVVGDGLAWMLGSKKKDGWANPLCLARNRIDRTTGIWTATSAENLVGDPAECTLAASQRQF